MLKQKIDKYLEDWKASNTMTFNMESNCVTRISDLMVSSIPSHISLPSFCAVS